MLGRRDHDDGSAEVPQGAKEYPSRVGVGRRADGVGQVALPAGDVAWPLCGVDGQRPGICDKTIDVLE
jgi:hypothetical protein